MSKFTMISVIVATYNQETTIARTLDAILRQQCHLPIEIVIGEDCSTDLTPQICDDYAQRYPSQIRVIHNAHNKGVVDNYFDCILACKGELIADCAGDDFWVDDKKLEKELRLMESDDSITLVHTAWRSYNERTQTASESPQLPFTAPITDGKTMLQAIITQTRTPVIHLCTSLYRADVILREYHDNPSLFRNKEWPCEDLQIAFIMAQNGKIGYLPDVTLHYSQGCETISAPKDTKKQFDFYRRATNLSYHLAEQYHIHNASTQQFFNHRAFAMLMYAFRAHDKNMLQQAITCKQQWNAHNTFGIILAKGITSCEPLWLCALLLRQGFIKFKQLFG